MPYRYLLTLAISITALLFYSCSDRSLKAELNSRALENVVEVESCVETFSGHKGSKAAILNKQSVAGRITGYVIKIIDGDTYDLLLQDNETVRIRMDAIDAPERGMPFYRVSKRYLFELIFNKTITISPQKKDRNGRIITRTYTKDGKECSAEIIKAGLAWHYKEYSDDVELAEYENLARSQKIKIWSDPHPLPPWKVRKLHRRGISTKDSFVLTEETR